MPRICLVTPGHLSTNPRLVKEAEATAAAGYDVQVLSCNYSAWGREADLAFSEEPWHTAHPVSFGPVAPFATRVMQGFRRKAAGCAEALGIQTDAVISAAWHPAGPELSRAARRIRADLYVAHYPAALPAVAAAARRYRAVYAFDAEDFHLGDPPERTEFDSQRRLTRAIEERYLPGAAYVTAASPDIADAYAAAYRVERPTVVLNVFPRGEAPPAASVRGWTEPGPSLYWFSQTIGPDRGIECVVAAMAIARSLPHLYLRGQFAAGYEAQLDALARSRGCRDRLHVLPSAPPDEMVSLAAPYDLGLASETGHTPARNYALTNKLFTYLLAGVPVLVSDTPAQARFAAGKEDCLFVYRRDDPASLAAAMDACLLAPERLERARRAAFGLAQARYNWDVEQTTFLKCVRQALATRQ